MQGILSGDFLRAVLSNVRTDVLMMLQDAQRDVIGLDIRRGPVDEQSKEASRLVFCSTSELKVQLQDAIRLGHAASGNLRGARHDALTVAAVSYDVVRVRYGVPMFFDDHMRRLCVSVSKCAAAAATSEGAAMRAHDLLLLDTQCPDKAPPAWFRRFYDAALSTVERNSMTAVEQNIKIVVWLDSQAPASALTTPAAAASAMSLAAFFIPSSYPPQEWYTPAQPQDLARGAHLALLYNFARHTPNCKTVQAELRAAAASQQKRLNVFESVLVHTKADNYLTPEGSRSNIVLVTDDGRVVSSLDKDILVGVTLLAVKRVCSEINIPFECRPIAVSDVVRARSVAMLGTSVGVLPISSIVVYESEDEQRLFEDAVATSVNPEMHEKFSVVTETVETAVRGRILKDSARDPVVQKLIAAYNSYAYQTAL